MIVVSVQEEAVIVSGHAGYDEHGKDIVCAAVSILAQTLIETIIKKTDVKINYVIQSGYIEIECKRKSRDVQLLFDAFFIGLQMLAANYPNNVQIKKTCAGMEHTKSYGEIAQALNA